MGGSDGRAKEVLTNDSILNVNSVLSASYSRTKPQEYNKGGAHPPSTTDLLRSWDKQNKGWQYVLIKLLVLSNGACCDIAVLT